MKLLEDMPSAVAHRPTQRRTGITLAVTVAILVVGALVGAFLMTRDTGAGDDAGAGGTAAGSGEPVALSAWVDGATQACATVAADHAVLTQGAEARADAANIATVEAGTRALVTSVREMPLPTDPDENAQAGTVVGLGDQADQAWAAISAAGAETATPDVLAQAGTATGAFVTALVDIGADCSALS